MYLKLSIIFPFLALTFRIVHMQDKFQCFECGYMEDHTGFKSKIPSQVEEIPFCGTDTINKDTTRKINVTEVSWKPSKILINCKRRITITIEKSAITFGCKYAGAKCGQVGPKNIQFWIILINWNLNFNFLTLCLIFKGV